MKNRVVFACLSLALCASLSIQAAEKVMSRDGKILVVNGAATTPIKEPVTFAGGIVINTNGLYKAGQGAERKLENGQAITADGMLHKPDGSVGPVFDHYVARGNRVYLVKDGGAPTPVSQNVVWPDGSVLSPDAILRSGGRSQRLIDGQTLRLDGNVIPTQDSVTFKDGKVTVQKDGALIPVRSSITMNDGTKVFANGTMVSFDGRTTTQLKDGQTITLPGAALRR